MFRTRTIIRACAAAAVATAAAVTITAGGAPSRLQLTAAHAPTLTCDDGNSHVHLAYTVTPRTCEILYPNLPLLGGAQLQDLHWSHWGSRTATATGISHGFHSGGSYRIKVRVYGLTHDGCTNSGDWYTRLEVAPAGYGWSKPYNTAYCLNGRSVTTVGG